VGEPSTLSVVIPSYRRLDRLGRICEAFLQQGAEQVVVVLDGPHPGGKRMLEALGDRRLEVIELPENRGAALARVVGIRASRESLVLLADDDVIPGADVVARHRLAHCGKPGGVVVGYMPVSLPHRRGPDESAAWLYAREYEAAVARWEEEPSAILVGLWTGNVSIDRELLMSAEVTKPSIPLAYSEDLDLGLRLALVGGHARFHRDIQSMHQHRRTLSGFLKEADNRGRSVAILEARWGAVPMQLSDLVSTRGMNVIQSASVSMLSSKVLGPIALGVLKSVYRVAGAAHLWRGQDASARLMRRGLAVRGYHAQKSRALNE
jgi:GT2 family glycosyltransferase